MSALHFLQNAVTEDDANSILCPIRVSAVATVVVYLALAVYEVIFAHHAFPYQEFGIGAGAVLAAAGGAIGLKQKLGA